MNATCKGMQDNYSTRLYYCICIYLCFFQYTYWYLHIMCDEYIYLYIFEIYKQRPFSITANYDTLRCQTRGCRKFRHVGVFGLRNSNLSFKFVSPKHNAFKGIFTKFDSALVATWIRMFHGSMKLVNTTTHK